MYLHCSLDADAYCVALDCCPRAVQVQEPPVDPGRPEQCPHSHAPLHVEPELSVEVL